jgi:hypothetical protein
MELINTVEELTSVWRDYISMEGISNLKKLLKKSSEQHPSQTM